MKTIDISIDDLRSLLDELRELEQLSMKLSSENDYLHGRNRLLTDSLVLCFTSIVIFRTAHMMACSVVACHLTALLRHPYAQLFTTISTPPSLDHLCGQKQQASISLSFSLSCRFPHLGISSHTVPNSGPVSFTSEKARTHLRPGF